MRVPTDAAILALHEKHAPTPEALDLVYTHCVIVCGIAEQLQARSGADASLDLVREEGFPEVIRRFASHHTGVGLSREDVLRQELPLPPGDYLAETPEETL